MEIFASTQRSDERCGIVVRAGVGLLSRIRASSLGRTRSRRILMLNKYSLVATRRVEPLLASVVLVVSLCGHVLAGSAAKYLPPPQPKGGAVATVEITPPPDSAGRQIFAGLKRDGRIVARGKAVVPPTGNATVKIDAMEATQALPDGEYELWLTINRDA